MSPDTAERPRCDVYLARRSMLSSHHGSLLDRVEHARTARFRLDADRSRFVLGAALLRMVVGQTLGLPAGSVELDRTCDRCGEPHGRPRVVNGGAHVSVSHAAEAVAVATTVAGPVGVDVEAVGHRAAFDHHAIAARVCSPAEQAFDMTPTAFFTMWTRKEAVLKATGRGLRLPMTDVAVTPPDQPPELISLGNGAPPCRMRDFDAGAGYCGAVAVLTRADVDFTFRDAAPLLRAHDIRSSEVRSGIVS